MAPYNGTQQWHHVHSPKVGRHLPPTIAHYNGTLRWHPAIAPHSLPQKLVVVTFPPNHNTLQWHPTMAPSSGTTSTAPCNGTLVPRPIRQSGSSSSPLIGSKNPYSLSLSGEKEKHPAHTPRKNLTWNPCCSKILLQVLRIASLLAKLPAAE